MTIQSDPAPIVMKGKLLYFSSKDEGFCTRASNFCNMKLDSIAPLQIKRETIRYHTLDSTQHIFTFELMNAESEPKQKYRIKFISYDDGPIIDNLYAYWVTGYDLDRNELVWMLVAHQPVAKKFMG